MKSEDFAMQELEKQRRMNAGEAVDDSAKPTTKFMIAGEAPLVMAKACELMVKDLTLRSWRHTDHNRRKTLQRGDVQAAVGESEIFDFLIDLVPRVASTSVSLTVPPPLPSSNAAQEVSPPQASATSDLVAHPSHQHADTAANLMGQLPHIYPPVNNPTESSGGENVENGSSQEQQQQHQSVPAQLQWGEGSVADNK